MFLPILILFLVGVARADAPVRVPSEDDVRVVNVARCEHFGSIARYELELSVQQARFLLAHVVEPENHEQAAVRRAIVVDVLANIGLIDAAIEAERLSLMAVEVGARQAGIVMMPPLTNEFCADQLSAERARRGEND